MTFGASWGARLAHLSLCFKCPYVDFQSPIMFWIMSSVLQGFEGERQFCFFFVISAFNLILVSRLSIPSSNCQGGSAQKDSSKQTNQSTSQKSVFGVTSTDFLGWWQHWAWSQVREESSLSEWSRWPGRPWQRGCTRGVERFGGGEGKAHLLYSWPLCVKQGLWAVTELKRGLKLSSCFSSTSSLSTVSPFSSVSPSSSHIFMLTELQPGKTYCVGGC